jgi:hypothetical protein
MRRWNQYLQYVGHKESETHMLREIDQRRCHGLTITLEWEPDTDRLLLWCEDDRWPDRPPLCYPVARSDARRAFLHPFAYAPQRTEESTGLGSEDLSGRVVGSRAESGSGDRSTRG